MQRLRSSGEWTSVENSASPFPSDYLLQIHVRRFDAEYTEGTGAPAVHVTLDCTLGRGQGRGVLATFTAAGSATPSANRLSEVVVAFEQASATALDALAQQLAQAVRLDLQRPAASDAQSPASTR